MDICQHISYIIYSMEKYKILERLGEGAFGKVYKALNKSTGVIVAIKKFEQKYKSREECLELR